jgi:membrane-associated phospholipid phosphatase
MPQLLLPHTVLANDRPQRLMPFGFALAALAALAIDVPLERWILAGGLPKWLTKISSLSEIFAHGWGVALIAVMIFVLDPARRAMLPSVLTAAFGAGLCANLLKLLLARQRPHHFDFVGGAFDTFGPLLPFGRGGSGIQGFPSSHAATAAGLALVLAWIYPHGSRLFVVLAALAGVQRLAVGAHFPSDVLAGTALGIAFASQCVGSGALARRFDRWEAARRRRLLGPALADNVPNNEAA